MKILFKKYTAFFLLFLFGIVFSYAQPGVIAKSSATSVLPVLLNNEHGIIPLKSLNTRKIALLNLRADTSFSVWLGKYANIRPFNSLTDTAALADLDESLKFFNTLVISLDASQLNSSLIHFIRMKAVGSAVIVAAFGPLDQLALLDEVSVPIIWCSTDTNAGSLETAEIIFGGIAAQSRLAKTVSHRYLAGGGFSTQKTRIGYGVPKDVGINGSKLTSRIDAIAEEAIKGKAAPGCVVMVVKNGVVIFEKAYGYHTYGHDRLTRTDDLFDLASVTKITVTTPTIMRLTEQGRVDLNKTMGYYLLQAQHTNKNNVILRNVMLHEAGFTPFIPFYNDLKPEDHRSDSSAAYPVKVADRYYLRKDYYEKIMWPAMLQSPITPPGKYVYSDLSMYVMKEVAEHQTSIPIQQYIQEEFYKPLGMKTAGYLPLRRFPKDRIVPTEDDKTFRGSLLQGYVHDQGAAMAGGIAGHAGNFATANDLAIYAQLLLNRGTYGGESYFKPETVDLFTSRQSATSRRGLGFDRWDPDPAKEYPSKLASPATYGHTGYTGTCIWIDPQNQLTYIFLSNRVNPDVSPFLSKLNIRPRIEDAIYEAIKEGL
ncbi:CubicO group peptidase, beta-lactamase class C family [bacterium A37T11]|nr:CubicO group peptidase, beta-lactamase class C family [bacterium A37T11]